MALTIGPVTAQYNTGWTLPNVSDYVQVRQHTITFDSSYPTGGEAITAADFGLSTLTDIWVTFGAGYIVDYDADNAKIKMYAPGGVKTPTTSGTINDNNNAATEGGAVYAIPKSIAPSHSTELGLQGTDTGLVTDSDTAASTGVALYVVEDDASFHPSYQLGHFEFVSPTDADGTGTVSNGGATFAVRDDDAAATNGNAVRAVAASGDLEATTDNAKDILVPLSDGTYIFINHATTGSTPELYFDEDASNSYERLLAVVVDNVDENFGLVVHNVDDADDAALQNLIYAKDDEYVLVHADSGPLTYAVGSGGPTCVIEGRPDAATLPGAVVVGAKAAGAGLDAALPSGRNGYVALSNGEYIQIDYAASPTGVALYANPAAASTDLTLECVVVDNADETFTVATTRTKRVDGTAIANEVDSTTDLSAVAIRVYAIGY
jgi:hypothetical protein